TPPSTTSSSAGQSPDAQYRVVRKRNRVPLSCGPCRHRKLKCNRGHPCDNCTKRGDTASCTYASPSNRKKNQSSHGASSSPDDMQNRIDRLEGLVLALMTNGAQSAGPAAAHAAIAGTSSISGSSADAPLDLDIENDDTIKEEDEGEESDVDRIAKSIGVMKVDNNKAFFASEAHWYAILGEISEVKNYFAEHKKQYEDQLQRYKAAHPDEDQPGTALLFRSTKQADRSEILASFPSKQMADRLVSRYFNTYDPAIHIIHGPTFQYDKHWQAPQETPIIWIGMVFAMMCIALQSYNRAGDEPPELRGKSWELSVRYSRLTAQCILSADVLQPIQYMMETLILHIHAETSRSQDAEAGVLVTVSVLVRLAMRMGYHRDSAPYATISPFQGEMRRRVWTVIRQADAFFSSQSGMPHMIRSTDTNVELPRNIYDDELHVGMKTLPPSRPESESTPCSYMIAKTKFVKVFGLILEFTNMLTCAPYDETMRLDQTVRETQASLPAYFKMRSMNESIHDSATIIMQRFSLDLFYLKSLCLLHRKLLGPSRIYPRLAYSRRTCIDACLGMLRHQATLQQEAQPGGRLRGVKWHISSLTTADFLLSAMIVCLDLYHTAEDEQKGRPRSTDTYTATQHNQEEMLAAIEHALSIWDSLREHSMEAYKAHATLSVMINKLKTHQARRQAQQNFAASFPDNAFNDDSKVAPEHSAAMTLGMLSTGALTPNTANMFNSQSNVNAGMMVGDWNQPTGLTPQYSGLNAPDINGPANAPSPFSLFAPGMGFQELPPTTNIDWDAWDSYIQG
ncbi:hypothetical protein M501DRAFT_902265, partial [Patellaria atrata CBS 101060]